MYYNFIVYFYSFIAAAENNYDIFGHGVRRARDKQANAIVLSCDKSIESLTTAVDETFETSELMVD